jgi:hypothetical protein
MRNIKTLVVTAGAAVVLGGIGVGVAQAASPGTAAGTPAVTSSTSSIHYSHESEARGRIAEGETHARHTGVDDTTGSGRVAEGETHARHTGDDATGSGRAAEGETHARHTGVDG